MVVTNAVEPRPDIKDTTWRDKLAFSKEMFEEAGIEYLVLPPLK